MKDFLRNHLGKLIAFLLGWASEGLLAVSDHLSAVLKALSGQ